MAEDQQETTIRIIFDLEEYNSLDDAALFKQRISDEDVGRFHYWAMHLMDWDALGRPTSFLMVLSAYVEIDLEQEQSSSTTKTL